MASEVKRLITRALDSLAVDGLLHAAGQDEPLPVRVVLQPVADRNKSYLEGTETPLGGYGQNYGIPPGRRALPCRRTTGWKQPENSGGYAAGRCFPCGERHFTCGVSSQRRKMMAALYDLREELTALLRQGLPDAAVTGEYPGEGRRYPQTVPAVAVGIAEAALQKLDYLGEQDAGEQSGRRWETRFQLELSAPRRSGAGELYRLFDQVSGLLLTYGSRYGLQEVDCGKAEYIRERDCFALTCTALCVLEETETQPGTAITGFEVTRRSD